MVKKIRNYGGDSFPIPVNRTSAPGGYQPQEVYNYTVNNEYPQVIEGLKLPAGSLLYSLASGTTDSLLQNGQALLPSGQQLDPNDYPELFTVLNINFGGNGLTTFFLPDYVRYEDTECYLKNTTVSGYSTGNNSSGLHGSGVVPEHTHQVGVGIVGTGPFGPGTSQANTTPVTGRTSYFGEAVGNTLKRQYLTPLITTQVISAPIGSVFSYLVPDLTLAANNLPSNALVCSGNSLFQATYPVLYSLIGQTYGSGIFSNTFSLPDLTGSFVGFPYPDPNVPSGSTVPASGNLAAHRHSVDYQYANVFTGNGPVRNAAEREELIPPPTTNNSYTGIEARPNNYSVVYCAIVSPL